MGDIDSADFDVICTTSEMGRSLTRSVIVETIDATWGSPTTSGETTSSVIGVVIPVNGKDIIELQGRIKTGDARCLFTVDTTMANDNIIVDGSNNYRVENLRVMNAGENDVFQKCLLIRMD